MREYSLWQNIRRNLTKPIWQRIETGGTGRGIPDVFGAFEGECCWIELKIAKGNRVDLRPEQIAWLIKFGQTGLKTFILVGTDKRKMYLFPGLKAIIVKDQGLKADSLLELNAPYEWSKLQEVLFWKN